MSKSQKRRLMTSGRTDSALISNDGNADDGPSPPAKSQAEQLRSLFIRSLPPSTTTQSLTALFSESYPLKHATVVLDPLTKQSKGYGFVTFADADDLQSAKEAFDGYLIDDKRMQVEIARPRLRQSQGTENKRHLEPSEDHSLSGGTRKPPRLIVRNLPWSIKHGDQLALLFRSFGKVKQASVPTRGPGLSAGFGFVLLRGHKNAEKAMEGLNGKEIDGRTIAVDWAVDKDTWTSLQPETEGEAQEDEYRESILNDDSREDSMSEDESSKASRTSDSIEMEQDGRSQDFLGNVVAGNGDSGGKSESDEQERQERAASGSEEEGEDEAIQHDDYHDEEDKSSTLFIRNLPFTASDESLFDHFKRFGGVRYARIVVDQTTLRSKGVGFVCFYNKEDVDTCIRSAPITTSTMDQQSQGPKTAAGRQSLLEDVSVDRSGNYTLLGRVLQVSRAVDRREAARLSLTSKNIREERDKDKRRLYLLGEGSVSANSPLYQQFSQTEIKMREDSFRQRQSLIRTNPTLHLSLTRLSIRNLPRNINSKALKALAREAAVGFAKDVKGGLRKQLTKEELSRGGSDMKDAEQARKTKGKGIVKQAKVVFEGREGSKVAEDSGAGRSRGYGFIEYSSHRWALMGLRWLNGHAVEAARDSSRNPSREKTKRLIVEFAIENAQVVMRRKEREIKAREHSKLSERKVEHGALPMGDEGSVKEQSRTSNGKGTKRKQDELVNKAEMEGLAKRQLIGRKMMLRRSKRKKAT